jgi:hypothetical protein
LFRQFHQLQFPPCRRTVANELTSAPKPERSTVVRQNSVDRKFIHVQCDTASPYLVDFDVGRSFQEPQMPERLPLSAA